MVKKSTSINLIKKDRGQLTSEVINWTLTIGRIMVIIVELIALSAFIYRFYLDNQLREINSSIVQKQQFLSTQQQKEASYRNLQDRLELESSTIDQGKQQLKIFKDIIALTPDGINFTNYLLNNNQIVIQLNLATVFPLSVFIDSLKKYPLTDYISINTIESKISDSTINVGLSVNLKGGGISNAGN